VTEPMVTAMMITGLPGRVDLAKRAVKSFLSQTWPRKELVIINDSLGTPDEYRIVDGDFFCDRLRCSDYVCPVREIMLNRQNTLGDLRNIALDAAAGDWITQFDDDDWSHPKRIEAMMQRRIVGHAVVVTSHVRYSIPTNTAYVYHNPSQGCAGIMLYPRTGDRYEPMKKKEDSRFYLDHFSDKVVIWENRKEFPHILLRFFHVGSISGESHVMRKYTDRKWYDQWVVLQGQNGAMNEPEIRYLAKIAAEIYGFNIGDAPLRALRGLSVQRDRESKLGNKIKLRVT